MESDRIRVCLLSVYSSNFIAVSISRPLVTLLSLQLIICSTSALSALSMYFPPLVISLPRLLISLSSIHPTQCSPAPIDPLIEISVQQAEAQREMLFRGNFRGAKAHCRFLSGKLSCQLNWASEQADIMRM